MSTSTSSPERPAVDCYHCGQPVPDEASYHAKLGAMERFFCCAGCLAIAGFIHEGGLSRYYEHREQLPEVAVPSSDTDSSWVLYDDPLVQASFVHPIHEEMWEAVLIIEGIRCAACVWLNEQHLKTQAGIAEVHIHYTSHRARIRWNPKIIQLSAIFASISAIGYRAWPFDTQATEQLVKREKRSQLFRLGVALLGMMQVMMYAWPVYFTVDGVAPDAQRLLNWVSWVLTTPVVFYSAGPMFVAAYRSVRHRHLSMDVPVVIGIAAAYIASCMALWRPALGQSVYFDSVTMFIGLLLLARYVEWRIRQQARERIEQIAHPIPLASLRWTDYPNGKIEHVPSIRLAIGDVIQVRPGEVFPIDGIIVEGESEAEEALLTGESRPIKKGAGDTVLAGSYNFASPLNVKVQGVGQQTRLAELSRLLDQALLQKPPVAELADRVAHHFVWVLLVLALVVGVVWIKIDPSRALFVTISVLVVSCPCALSLATPAVLAAAMHRLAKQSVLITRGHALEALSTVTDIVLDKTGTLTHGQFKWVDTHLIGAESLAYYAEKAVALEMCSEHPLAKQLVASYLEDHVRPASAHQLKNVPGHGIEGCIDGEYWRIGTHTFVLALSPSVDSLMPIIPVHCSAVYLGNTAGIQALFLFSDTVREGAKACVEWMQQQGVRVHMLSGDRRDTVAWWANNLGISLVSAEADPMAKHAYVKALQSKGAIVAMVGDGINDAPVLALANVSVSFASGAPLAQIGADMVMMRSDLNSLIESVKVAVSTRQIIRQNLAWAFIYNLLAIPLAATGYVTPLMAGIGMALSSLCVVLNACRIGWK